jgi:hypothetical protein
MSLSQHLVACKLPSIQITQQTRIEMVFSTGKLYISHIFWLILYDGYSSFEDRSKTGTPCVTKSVKHENKFMRFPTTAIQKFSERYWFRFFARLHMFHEYGVRRILSKLRGRQRCFEFHTRQTSRIFCKQNIEKKLDASHTISVVILHTSSPFWKRYTGLSRDGLGGGFPGGRARFMRLFLILMELLQELLYTLYYRDAHLCHG